MSEAEATAPDPCYLKAGTGQKIYDVLVESVAEELFEIISTEIRKFGKNVDSFKFLVSVMKKVEPDLIVQFVSDVNAQVIYRLQGRYKQ